MRALILLVTGCGLGAGPTVGFSSKGHSFGVEGGLSAIAVRGNVGASWLAGERATYGTAALLLPIPFNDLDGGYAVPSGAIGYGRDARGGMFVGQLGVGGMYLHGKRDFNGEYRVCGSQRDQCFSWSVSLSLSGHYRRGWQLWLDPRVDVFYVPDLPTTH